jgi:hypothetical protein
MEVQNNVSIHIDLQKLASARTPLLRSPVRCSVGSLKKIRSSMAPRFSISATKAAIESTSLHCLVNRPLAEEKHKTELLHDCTPDTVRIRVELSCYGRYCLLIQSASAPSLRQINRSH